MSKSRLWQRAVQQFDFVVTSQERVLAAALLRQGASVTQFSLTPLPGCDVVGSVMAKDSDKPIYFGAELKSGNDLVSSIIGRKNKDGKVRLDSQLSRMLESFGEGNAILMIRGKLSVTQDGYVLTDRGAEGVLYDALWNRLDRWQRAGVVLHIVEDHAHAAHRLISLRNYRSRA